KGSVRVYFLPLCGNLRYSAGEVTDAVGGGSQPDAHTIFQVRDMGHEDWPDGLVEGGGVEIGHYADDGTGLAVEGKEFAQGVAGFLKAQGVRVGFVDEEFVGTVSGSDVVSCQE